MSRLSRTSRRKAVTDSVDERAREREECHTRAFSRALKGGASRDTEAEVLSMLSADTHSPPTHNTTPILRG